MKKIEILNEDKLSLVLGGKKRHKKNKVLFGGSYAKAAACGAAVGGFLGSVTLGNAVGAGEFGIAAYEVCL